MVIAATLPRRAATTRCTPYSTLRPLLLLLVAQRAGSCPTDLCVAACLFFRLLDAVWRSRSALPAAGTEKQGVATQMTCDYDGDRSDRTGDDEDCKSQPLIMTTKWPTQTISGGKMHRV